MTPHRRAHVTLLLLALLPSLSGCGAWQRLRIDSVKQPTSFRNRILVVSHRQAWELQVASIDSQRVVGRALRRWEFTEATAPRWHEWDHSPEAVAQLNAWRLVSTTPEELVIPQEEIARLLFFDDRGNLGLAIAGAVALSFVVLIAAGFAWTGGRID